MIGLAIAGSVLVTLFATLFIIANNKNITTDSFNYLRVYKTKETKDNE